MKLFRFLSILFLACLVFSVNGQSKTTKSLNKGKICKSNSVSFPCPKDFSLLFKDEANGLILFREKDVKTIGLFVLAKSGFTDKNQLLNNAKLTLLQKLFPKQTQNYVWKTIDLIFFSEGEPLSKYDVSFGAEKGYNQNHLVISNYRQIKFSGKDIFVGYVYEFGTGNDATEGFEQDFGDSLFNSCLAQVELIFLITGETIAEDSEPCSIMGTMETSG